MPATLLSHPFTYGVRSFDDVPTHRGKYTAHKEDYISQFAKLVRKWRAETAFSSSITDSVNHQAFRDIVAMGDKVLPLIISELKKQPDMLVGAMQFITHANPVPQSDQGNIIAMASAWIEWYKRNK